MDRQTLVIIDVLKSFAMNKSKRRPGLAHIEKDHFSTKFETVFRPNVRVPASDLLAWVEEVSVFRFSLPRHRFYDFLKDSDFFASFVAISKISRIQKKTKLV